jgi:hypothetical protein
MALNEANETLQNALKDFLVINSNISTNQMLLALVSIFACMACVYIVFIFARRAQNSAYLRQSFVDIEYKKELDGLLRNLQDEAIRGPLDYSEPAPDGYGPTSKLWIQGGYRLDEIGPWGVVTGGWGSTNEVICTPSGSTVAGSEPDPTKRQERENAEIERKNTFNAFKNWENAERKRMAERRKEAESKARRRAELQVPGTIDIALLGGGFGFILEFSTVIVIIFTILILGILNVMQGREISTILAAIAGYVLGKSTSKEGLTDGATAKPEPAKTEPAKTEPAKTEGSKMKKFVVVGQDSLKVEDSGGDITLGPFLLGATYDCSALPDFYAKKWYKEGKIKIVS